MTLLCKIWFHDWVDFRYSNLGFHNQMRVCIRCGRVETRLDSEYEDWGLSGYIDEIDPFKIAVAKKKLREKRTTDKFKQRRKETVIPVNEIIKIHDTGWESLTSSDTSEKRTPK